ncbi:class I SAM-dependent methyltransferase [Clostridium estertheticum]|uniref:class I SAM-dependent methyltransferase n=1 Tax=Clostridium estertheticum TaxID=238834 RepID=UPI001C6E30C9|nr:rRNA adenine N-6-methyltransferase family protein [Clostridium estertheticum]MBW9173451.1 SAM-dependent methyltransferase [Clostridium estertheticum]MCB2343097.1 SAM-dependent methyltransferase [Clostridium estertheticum]WLC77573.1 SAM-dependent methyltransferase [Clostridium estertheticum]
MFKFIKEFIKKPNFIGAVAPSSEYLAKKMIEDINFKECNCIIEYGPGTGVFTEKLIARKKENTLLLVIENNKEFCEGLLSMYGYKKNVKIINDGAENIKKYLKQYNIKQVDYVVSGLPFTVLPVSISNTILKNTKEILSNEGEFITFQYSLLKKNFFKNYFNSVKVKKAMINLPPAYVLKCRVNDEL